MGPKVVSLEYLESMSADLTKQAEQHYANWQATLGALDLLKHLVVVASSETQSDQHSLLKLVPSMEG